MSEPVEIMGVPLPIKFPISPVVNWPEWLPRASSKDRLLCQTIHNGWVCTNYAIFTEHSREDKTWTSRTCREHHLLYEVLSSFYSEKFEQGRF